MSNNSRIARPLSITSILQVTPPTMNNRQRISSTCDYDKKKSSHKRPTSGLSKSHSMHRLAYPSDDDEDDFQHQIYHRALLSRATTTPMPRPSSLIKRFSSDHGGVLVPKSTKTNSVKSASSTTSTALAKTSAMKRSSSLMNPVDYASGNEYTQDLRIGQKVSVPSMAVFGTVRFFGETRFTNGGNWVGIELDIKGSGKNDGSIQGYSFTHLAHKILFNLPFS